MLKPTNMARVLEFDNPNPRVWLEVRRHIHVRHSTFNVLQPGKLEQTGDHHQKMTTMANNKMEKLCRSSYTKVLGNKLEK